MDAQETSWWPDLISRLVDLTVLLIGILIGHLFTKSAQVKQLRAQFNYNSMSKWIDDIIDAWSTFYTAVDAVKVGFWDTESMKDLYAELEAKSEVSLDRSIDIYREERQKLLINVDRADLSISKLYLLLSHTDKSQLEIIKKLKAMEEKISNLKNLEEWTSLDELTKSIDESIRLLINSEKEKLTKIV